MEGKQHWEEEVDASMCPPNHFFFFFLFFYFKGCVSLCVREVKEEWVFDSSAD